VDCGVCAESEGNKEKNRTAGRASLKHHLTCREYEAVIIKLGTGRSAADGLISLRRKLA